MKSLVVLILGVGLSAPAWANVGSVTDAIAPNTSLNKEQDSPAYEGEVIVPLKIKVEVDDPIRDMCALRIKSGNLLDNNLTAICRQPLPSITVNVVPSKK